MVAILFDLNVCLLEIYNNPWLDDIKEARSTCIFLYRQSTTDVKSDTVHVQCKYNMRNHKITSRIENVDSNRKQITVTMVFRNVWMTSSMCQGTRGLNLDQTTFPVESRLRLPGVPDLFDVHTETKCWKERLANNKIS